MKLIYIFSLLLSNRLTLHKHVSILYSGLAIFILLSKIISIRFSLHSQHCTPIHYNLLLLKIPFLNIISKKLESLKLIYNCILKINFKYTTYILFFFTLFILLTNNVIIYLYFNIIYHILFFNILNIIRIKLENYIDSTKSKLAFYALILLYFIMLATFIYIIHEIILLTDLILSFINGLIAKFFVFMNNGNGDGGWNPHNSPSGPNNPRGPKKNPVEVTWDNSRQDSDEKRRKREYQRAAAEKFRERKKAGLIPSKEEAKQLSEMRELARKERRSLRWKAKKKETDDLIAASRLANASTSSVYDTSGPSSYNTSTPSFYDASGPSSYNTSTPSFYGASGPNPYNTSTPSFYDTPAPNSYNTPAPNSYNTPTPNFYDTPTPNFYDTPTPNFYDKPTPDIPTPNLYDTSAFTKPNIPAPNSYNDNSNNNQQGVGLDEINDYNWGIMKKIYDYNKQNENK